MESILELKNRLKVGQKYIVIGEGGSIVRTITAILEDSILVEWKSLKRKSSIYQNTPYSFNKIINGNSNGQYLFKKEFLTQ